MKYLLIAFLLLQGALSYAQSSVDGIVVSKNATGDFEPVPFANVYWQGTNFGTFSDSVGAFKLAVHDSSRTLIASFVGFKADTIKVKNLYRTFRLVLNPAANIDAVTIQGRQATRRMDFINPMQTELISEKELFKAACCNLSESFETNPSVDVNFTDAITGTRQIKMLGLDGPYTMISRENMVGIRGLGNAFGLSFVPGAWVQSIQVTKGVGAVGNGYESIAGQINVEMKKPEDGEKTFFNVFGNQSGRTEVNFVKTKQVNKNWGTTVLLHGNIRPIEQDNNDDNFMDFPLQEQINLQNRWKFKNDKGLMGQIGLHYLFDDKNGGQIGEQPRVFNSLTPPKYKLRIQSERVEMFGKMGYVFPMAKYKSMGLQVSGVYHDQDSYFGLTNYDGTEKSLYANYIYQTIINNTNHKIKTGASFMYDEYEEQLNANDFNRIERVPGAFIEYTYEPHNSFTLVAGLRGDYHNIYDPFITPRIHARWASSENTVFRVLAGSGQRTANIFAERQSVLASSRAINIIGQQAGLPYGLEAERAWNFGFNLTKEFTLDYREGYISFDAYRTDFQNQVVFDLDQSSNQVLFYNLDGKSFSNSAQIELSYELIKFLDMRLAYRWIEVKTDYLDQMRLKPFTPRHRWFANFAYTTVKNDEGANWSYDVTAQWFGEQRIPGTDDNLTQNQRSTEAPSFTLVNAQVTRNVNKRWAVYLGVENMFNFKQENPIIAADNPFISDFDASMVWGPIFGRMFYGGIRFQLEKKEE